MRQWDAALHDDDSGANGIYKTFIPTSGMLSHFRLKIPFFS